MIFRHSLRTRIIIAFCLFGAVLGTVYGTAVFISLDLIDDHLVDTRLTQEIDHIVVHLQQYPDASIPTSPNIKAYIGTTSMPAHIRDMVSGLAEGFHEAYQGPDEYHIAVRNLPNFDQPLYLVYDVSAMEFTEKRKLIIGFVLAGVLPSRSIKPIRITCRPIFPGFFIRMKSVCLPGLWNSLCSE